MVTSLYFQNGIPQALLPQNTFPTTHLLLFRENNSMRKRLKICVLMHSVKL